MNAQPMGFYAPAQIVRDAREHGVVVRPPCVNASRWDCTLEPYGGRYLAVRLGLRQIRGLSNADGAKIVGARELTAFESVEDVWRRSGVQRAAIEKLADGDAFHSFGADRRQGLWKVRGLGEAPLPLFAAADRADQAVSAEGIEPDVELRPLTDGREVNRAIACAAPGVSATATRAVNPARWQNARRRRQNRSSPPWRCAQPVRSSHSPSGGVAAAIGDQRRTARSAN